MMGRRKQGAVELDTTHWVIIGLPLFCFLFIWLNVSLSRALWWIGLVFGFLVLSFAMCIVRDRFDYRSNSFAMFDFFRVVFLWPAGLIFLFGVLGCGVTIFSAGTRIVFGPSYSDEPVEYNRR
jgi:hypothetical protein